MFEKMSLKSVISSFDWVSICTVALKQIHRPPYQTFSESAHSELKTCIKMNKSGIFLKPSIWQII